jgi:hypothetical protein
MTIYTVIADRAIGGVELHSDTDLTAAIGRARWLAPIGMGGFETIEVIWYGVSGEAVVEWSARAVVAS